MINNLFEKKNKENGHLSFESPLLSPHLVECSGSEYTRKPPTSYTDTLIVGSNGDTNWVYPFLVSLFFFFLKALL